MTRDLFWVESMSKSRQSVFGAAVVLVCASGVCGCARSRSGADLSGTGDGRLATTVHVADQRTAGQLISGFNELEHNAWRWTQGKFAVRLAVPPGSRDRGAVVELAFSIPQASIARLSSITLSASAPDVTLHEQTYSKPGEYVYSREVPGSALRGESLTVAFALDKYLPAGSVDERELGVIVTTVGLRSK